MAKLKVYLHSLEFPTVGFVDKEGAMHACAQAQKTAFERLGSLSGLFGNRYLNDEEREVLMRVEDFCRSNGLEFEIVDVGPMNFLSRLKLRMKGLKTPSVCCGEKVLQGVPTEEGLRRLLNQPELQGQIRRLASCHWKVLEWVSVSGNEQHHNHPFRLLSKT